MRKLLLVLLLPLLLALPASAAIDLTGALTTLSAEDIAGCPSGVCAVGNWTVPTITGVAHASVNVRSASSVASTVTVTIAGVAASFKSTNGRSSASNRTYQFTWSAAALSGITGSQAVVCSMTGETAADSSTMCQVTLRHIAGAVQTNPTNQVGTSDAASTTVSLDLTSVVAGSAVCWVTTHTSDPGAWVSPSTDAAPAVVNSRYMRLACLESVGGGSVAVDPTWTNSITSGGVSLAIEAFVDVTAPAPGNSGTITTANITQTGMDLTCTAGTDAVTAQANLQYEFRQSSTNNMGSVANAEANGTIIRAYAANDCTHTATGLSAGTGYWFQVIVKDEAGNKAIYTQKNETTLANILLSGASVVECFGCSLFDIQAVTIPDGLESAVYAGVQFTSLGGAAPHTFAVSGGALPSGLALSATGALTGTPGATAAGSYNFTVQATDAEGGKAVKSFAIVVNTDAAGSLTFYEDAEDGNLTADPTWTAAGGCGVTSTGTLEGNDEVTKTGATDCVLFDNVDESQVFYAQDIAFTTPATNRDQFLVGVDSSGAVLFSCRYETDQDLFCKTPGQTGFETGGVPRGFYLGKAGTASGESVYLEIHSIAGTGANATFRARINGGIIQSFNAGTATANVDRIILRDDDDGAGDFVNDRLEAKDDDWPARGPLPGGDPPAGPPPPWVSDFIPQRVHYVSTTGSGSGTIGSPESLSTANGHDVCGDLHILRSGTYLISSQISGSAGVWGPSLTCTSGNPSVWKGYVNPTTGVPEQAKVDGSIRPTGAHQWFVNLEATTSVAAVVGQTFNVRGHDIKLINNVVHEAEDSSNVLAGGDYFRTVAYGNISYLWGVNSGSDVGPSHGFYMSNKCSNGMKYLVHNISMEPGPGPGAEKAMQFNDTTGGKGIDCLHIEENFLGDCPNEECSMVFNDTGGIASTNIVIKNNWLVDLYHTTAIPASIHVADGHDQPLTATITGNYFARASMHWLAYWGSTGAHANNFNFQNNEIYDPPGGIHVAFKTKQPGGASNGGQKILDADVWNNNIYGGTFIGKPWCNNTNSGNSTLAQWRTRTDACRVTPGSAGFDLASTNPANPTTDKVEVIENQYQCASGCPFTDQARGNIYCVNWDANSTCAADISSVVGFGKTYIVRYARGFYGTAAASGTCPGSGACPVTLPTRRSAAEATGKFTNAYVITGQP